MRRLRLTHTAALAVTIAVLAAPVAGAQSQDLRNPDRREAPFAAPTGQDLRLPDSRDAAAGRGTFNAPQVTVVRVPQRPSADDGGIDWTAAGIGAGSLLAAILIGLAGTSAVLHRRRAAGAPSVTTG
jgi:hypothetical protein